MYNHIPNILSLIRIILSPVFYFFILSGDSKLISYSSFIFLFAALTDYFDGWFARKFHAISSLGRFVDPLADKILNILAFVSFAQLKIIPLWMVLVIIFRDIFTTVLRVYAESINKPIQTSITAKWKTFLQMVFIAYILILLLLINSKFIEIDKDFVNLVLYSQFTYYAMLVLTMITIWTMLEYLIVNDFFKTK